jgi:hypothetical protein
METIQRKELLKQISLGNLTLTMDETNRHHVIAKDPKTGKKTLYKIIENDRPDPGIYLKLKHGALLPNGNIFLAERTSIIDTNKRIVLSLTQSGQFVTHICYEENGRGNYNTFHGHYFDYLEEAFKEWKKRS